MSKKIIGTVDIYMPTWNSEKVLSGTLSHLASSMSYADLNVNRLILMDNLSDDDTVYIARTKAEEYGWTSVVKEQECSLPRAREVAAEMVQTQWFLFLDDDVRLSEGYLRQITRCIAPSIGAVQGRKSSSTGHPWEWCQRRMYRGGTHATLIRTEALQGISIPKGVKVLEDEYIRRHVESLGFIWVFNHQARYEHESMERHKIGWEQGIIAGRFGLMPFHSIILLIADSIISAKNPVRRIILMIGYLYGLISKNEEKSK